MSIINPGIPIPFYPHRIVLYGKLTPCLENLQFWGDEVLDAVYTNKIEGEDERAVLTLNGIDNTIVHSGLKTVTLNDRYVYYALTIKTGSTITDQGLIGHLYGATNVNTGLIFIQSGVLTFRWTLVDNGIVRTDLTSTLNINTEYDVVFVIDRLQGLYAYIDGVLVDSNETIKELSLIDFDFSVDFRLGAIDVGNGNPLNGFFSNVQLHQGKFGFKNLTEDEISNISSITDYEYASYFDEGVGNQNYNIKTNIPALIQGDTTDVWDNGIPSIFSDVKISSNMLYFDGVSAKSEIQDTIIGYVNRVEVLYSIDNLTWQTKTTDVFTLDEFYFALGIFNELYVEGYYSRVRCYADAIQEEPVLDFLLSSNNTTDDNDITGATYEDDYTLQSLMNVFSNVPIQSGDDYLFEDSSDFNNNVKIIDSPCAQINTGEQSILTLPAGRLDFNSDFSLEIGFKINQDINILCENRGAVSGEPLRVYTTKTTENIVWLDINNTAKIFAAFDPSEKHVVRIDKVGSDYSLFVDDLLKGSVTRVSTIQDATILFAHENPSGSAPNYLMDGQLHFFKFNDDVYIPNMASPYDVTGNNNHLTISSANVAAMQGGKANIYPYHLLKGCSVVGSDIIPALLDETADAQGNTIQYPKGSGIIEQFPNSYTVPEFYPLNQIIPSGNYDWAGINALVESAYIEKSKVGSAISNLTINQDLPDINVEVLTPETYIHQYTNL